VEKLSAYTPKALPGRGRHWKWCNEHLQPDCASFPTPRSADEDKEENGDKFQSVLLKNNILTKTL
jgi:hypothetical protein